jgi:hypothetical protein
MNVIAYVVEALNAYPSMLQIGISLSYAFSFTLLG